jgi:hypothetical protein
LYGTFYPYPCLEEARSQIGVLSRQSTGDQPVAPLLILAPSTKMSAHGNMEAAAVDPYSLTGITTMGCVVILNVECIDSLLSAIQVLQLRDECSSFVVLRIDQRTWFRHEDYGGFADDMLEDLATALETSRKCIKYVSIRAVSNVAARGSVVRLLAVIGQIRTLRKLHWHASGLTTGDCGVKHLSRVLERARFLRDLQCSRVRFSGTKEEIDEFADAITHSTHLESFELHKCNIDDTYVETVLTMISQLPKLENLQLSFGASLLQRFKKKSNLTVIDIASTGGVGLVAASIALTACKRCRVLTIASNLLKAECTVLGQLIQALPSLKWLDIHIDTFNDDVHLVTLVNALKENSTMTTLSFWSVIRGQDISLSKDIQQLFVSLLETSNFTLTSLSFVWLGIDPVLKRNINWFQKLNGLIDRKELLRDANATKQTWIEALESSNKDVSCLFYILSSNPMLCSSEEADWIIKPGHII